VSQYPFIFDGTIMENILYGLLAAGHATETSNALVDRAEVLQVVDRVGLTDDILKTGLNAHLSPERDRDFAQRLTVSREIYHEKLGAELAEVVDFFVVTRFQHYSSLIENIVFGHPNGKGLDVLGLSKDPSFMAFLREMDLLHPLLDLGEELAVQTVTLLRDLREDAFFFQLSPIGIDEFEEYNSVVGRLEDSGRDHIARRDREALVGLALRFVPARHKMVALPHDLEERLLDARKAFITKMMKKDPGAFTFYHPTEYFYSQSILNNLLFGNLKEEQPQTLERLRDSVVDLLREQGMIDEVMAAGLEFQVGSKGDRLSGGQKQKIAIARALLKKTPILILDEATASLDNTSQARIQQVLSGELKGRSTLIAVVHRLEMVRDFDGIAVMKAGRIVEMGRYDDLIAQKGLFYDLARGA
jgi:putative ABC transport system ATP-binding protein